MYMYGALTTSQLFNTLIKKLSDRLKNNNLFQVVVINLAAVHGPFSHRLVVGHRLVLIIFCGHYGTQML